MEEQLHELDCPFTWDVPEPESRAYILQHLYNNEDQSHFIINGFCVFILECFERGRDDEIELAIKKASECELQLSEYSPIGLFSKSDKYVWERSYDALWHVLLATQAHLAYRNNDLQYAEERIQKIVPKQSLDESNIAALSGIKSRFFQSYGGYNPFSERAIKYAREAVQLDDSVPLWHFLLGKSIARYRRSEFPYECPDDEECHELQRAWKECKKPDMGVMLLQTYQTLFKNTRGKEVDNLKLVIRETIREIISCAGCEWYIYWRCAHVCVRLPRGVVPPEEIKDIIDLAVEFSERAHNTNKKHLWEVFASYYKFIERNHKMALEFSIKAADEGEVTCVFDVLSLSYRINKDKDLLPVIDKYIDQYKSYSKTLNLFITKANYLMFIKHEINEAFKIYLDVMEEDCSSYQILKCRPLFGEAGTSYSLYSLLKDELNKAIERSRSVERAAVYQSYLCHICNYEKLAVNK